MQTLEEFEFEFQLDEEELNEELAERVFEANCSDAMLWENEHIVHLSFERTAESVGEAVEEALAQLRDAGIQVTTILAPFSFAEAG
jgi:hypothetical protein